MKRTPLRRTGTLGRRIGLAPHRTEKTIRYSQVRRDVEARANGWCELRTPVCTKRGTECHHLILRSAGGEDSLGNCVWTCPDCHRFAHAHPALAVERGWIRRRTA